jgi:hypothetical protein
MSTTPIITSPKRPEKLTIRRDPNAPTEVVLLVDGQYVCNIPWQAADRVAQALIRSARLCEQEANANKIIRADALLIRTGAPFSLTSDPRMRAAAFTDAQWDSAARKGMPIRKNPVTGAWTVPSKRDTGTPELKFTDQFGNERKKS